jgi:hypothetical protein
MRARQLDEANGRSYRAIRQNIVNIEVGRHSAQTCRANQFDWRPRQRPAEVELPD